MSKLVTRQQALDALADSVDDWSLETLQDYARENYITTLQKCSIKDLEVEYNLVFNGYDTDIEDDYTKIINTKASKLLLDKVAK